MSKFWARPTVAILMVAGLIASLLAIAPSAEASPGSFIGGTLRPGGGHWMVDPGGRIGTDGSAPFYGDMRAIGLNKPVVGMASTPSGNGYWLVASDGGIFSFGDARFLGSTGSIALNKPVVGMAATASGNGYWLVASDGGIFAYGDARFFGSTGSIALNKPVVGMAATASGNGYWLVASDGGIFAYGDARFFGSTGSIALNKPISAMTATGTGSGYWLVASDGGIFAFGDAPFLGSGAGTSNSSAVAIMRSGAGYAMVRTDGSVLRAEPESNSVVMPPDTSVPPVTSTPPVTSGPAGVGGNWRLAFQDEFNGPSLNTGKWGTCYIWATHGCTNAGNNELQWYLPDNVSQNDGKLNLTAKRQNATGLNNKVFNYTSGMVTTGPHQPTRTPAKFEFTYGYVEARVKVPKGKALWPAVWLLPSTGKWPPEIDIMEMLGDDTTDAHLTVHWRENGVHRSSGGGYRGPDFAADFHTFAVDWQPNSLTWYVDGVPRRTYSNPAAIPHEPMYVLLNLAVGGDWPGAPDANTPFPSTYQVDHVRVWQRQ